MLVKIGKYILVDRFCVYLLVERKGFRARSFLIGQFFRLIGTRYYLLPGISIISLAIRQCAA